jgi:hypothetical protein
MGAVIVPAARAGAVAIEAMSRRAMGRRGLPMGT